jgi:hypothetical protein
MVLEMGMEMDMAMDREMDMATEKKHENGHRHEQRQRQYQCPCPSLYPIHVLYVSVFTVYVFICSCMNFAMFFFKGQFSIPSFRFVNE